MHNKLQNYNATLAIFPVDNNPLDGDMQGLSGEGANLEFSNAEGEDHSNLFEGFKKRRSQRMKMRQERQKSKNAVRYARASAKTARGEAAKTKAKSKLETAKSLGKDDGTASILAASAGSPDGTMPVATDHKKVIVIAAVVGGVLLLAGIGFYLYKHKKNKK